jgi:hypothetical protein
LKHPSILPKIVVVAIFLAACSTGSTDPTPTPLPSPTAVSPVAEDAVTVGALVDQVESAWPSVQSMRTTFWSTNGEVGATPMTDGTVTVEEAVLPASRRVRILINGEPADEQVAVDGRVYMKGALVPQVIAPMVDTETWVEVDPGAANGDTPIARQMSYLLSPVVPPFTDLTAATAELPAGPADDVSIGGRTCRVYTFGDAGGISYELSIDENDLPCRLVQRAGGHANVTLYEFNAPDLAISAPEVATPSADPGR